MTNILVTTDFSTNSKTAIRFALKLASQTPCKLTFFHVLELLTPTSWRKEDAIDFVQTAIQTGEERLESFLKPIFKQAKWTPIDYDIAVEMGMDVDNHIVHYAKEIKVDYICMSTRGAGVLKKIIGTNASTLVNTSPIPVIIVPQKYRIKTLKKVGYASDFENIDKELKIVTKLATALNIKTEVYHFYYQLHKSDNKETFEAIKATYQTDKINFLVPKLHLEQSLVENLQTTVKNRKPSILVMFTKHKKNWFERFFFESKTAEMTYNITVPLIAIRK